ncbi:DUF427 domain-containing protein [Aliiruegeria lutimaris]|uniref:Uncharacterized conserved protein, DUF427 family n=1 Tax=Aliiruegeria lutimaris TaxID=571298 RepID=A0A1G9KNE4_9RHOB|nr:DUF427 domain-containing protein [Aliiruegeria lutimaris]SDL50925.1 Uncharacterized conserved protein, DUF427 family [Aliiruegeria lutimaris]
MTLPPENVQDYPRPPRLEPVPYPIRIILGDEIVAYTSGALRVLETHHAPTYYLPPGDVLADLREASGRSVCEWKGAARYFDVIAGRQTAPRAAWCYTRPTRRFKALAGYLAFYANAMDGCFVDGERGTPQPGAFYGGWVTPNLTGIPKGAPGTEHW